MATTTTSGFYDGSLVLEPLARLISLPIDQVNHLVCQLFCLVFGYAYRTTFAPWRVGATVRHVIQVILGVSLVYFCFGRQTIHMIAQSLTCYFLMMFMKPGQMEKVVFVASLGYLCLCHIYRQIYDYGGYTLDITGPLMMNTQRLSSLAFAVRDGTERDEKKLTPMMKKQGVKSLPGMLEFFSYSFCYHGVMCGPFAFYKDYLAFIEGTDQDVPQEAVNSHTEGADAASASGEPNDVANNVNASPQPVSRPRAEPTKALVKALLTCTICAVITVVVHPYCRVEYLMDPEFSQKSWFSKMVYIVISTSIMRQKYYFVWKMAESSNISNGLGFNGYDKAGNAKWDLISNADIHKVELATSLKVVLDNWNTTTTHWLRYVIYERVHSTWLVFTFSAFWHGFYAGYYITFLTGALNIEAGRLIRRYVRPHFQSTEALKRVYAVITFLGTRLVLAYCVFAFVLLQFWLAYDAYRQIYFVLHWLPMLIIVALTLLPQLGVIRAPKRKEA